MTALAVLLAGPVSAEQGQAGFAVGVTIPVRVTLEVVEQPAQLVLSADDIARGYKDLSARYLVHNNDRNGCLVKVARRPGAAKSIEVRGIGQHAVLVDDVIDIHLPRDAFVQELPLEFRFVLEQSLQPGAFELPLSVAAMPI